MIVYGYVKQYRYSADGTLLVQVRIPNIHGAWKKSQDKGQQIRSYTEDANLPWYPSMLLPYLPNEGEVVVLSSLNASESSGFIVLGLTGGSTINPATDSLR